ncbi:beta-ketoacyl synthase N-terminal-like domain-containing protein [Candidatus Spongiihabitans sp.]|uniref:beta-ketoacyl synthase N-terminal-like domain-containing protein n=1 Tax=Candidatus Spongiihabitans sp. TaxID=3101308 RepID=UPI003C6EE8A2
MAPDLDRHIAITGIGAIGSFGIGVDALWSHLDADRLDFKPCSRYQSKLLCAEAAKPNLRRLLRSSQLSRSPLVSQFAIVAVHLALEQAGIAADMRGSGQSMGLVYGTSNGPGAATQEIYDDLIERGPASVKPRVFQESVFNAPASLVSIHFGLKGPVQSLASGCCGHSVLYQAQMLLARPEVGAVIALCSDELCEATQSALRVLRWQAAASPVGGSPAAKNRGAISSEGAAALVLEPTDFALTRGGIPLAELAGAGFSNDAWQLAYPAEDGRGLAAAMTACLEDSDALPGDIDIILSATANTDVDDRLETAAIRSVFGDSIPMVATTKTNIGHAMGAATMLDTVLATEIIRRDKVPGSLDCDGAFAAGIDAALCSGISLNGLFGAALVRRNSW